MDAAGVDYALAVQPSVYGWDNRYLCDCIDSYPDRLIGVCLVNPHAADAAERLRYWCAERGCRGLRINTIGQPDANWLLAHRLEPLWAEAIRLAVPLCLQVNVAHAQAVAQLADQHPELTIIVDYFGAEAFRLGSPMEFLGAVAARENILCKDSFSSARFARAVAVPRSPAVLPPSCRCVRTITTALWCRVPLRARLYDLRAGHVLAGDLAVSQCQ